MPQIEQIQSIYWGALRPDPIDLATDGINVATGPNGSGKTTLLDAIKLGLGVDELGGRRPEEYIFNGGDGDSPQRADRALIKLVFSNPVRPGKRERVFADAGRGCESADYVTAICEVARGNRLRYAIQAGYIQWGGDGRTIDEDIHRLRELIPDKHWMSKRKWSELLARAGVSRELLGVLALKQGETDRVLAGDYQDLLRTMLELTGKQETLDRFNETKLRLAAARADYDQTMRKLDAERSHLRTLELQAGAHDNYVKTKARHERIERVELPLARRAELLLERERAVRDRTTLTETLTATRAAMVELGEEIEALEAQQAAAAREHAERIEESERAQTRLQAAAERVGLARKELTDADAAIAAADGAPLNEETAAAAAAEATARDREHGDRVREQHRLRQEVADLEAGLPPRPPEMDAFRTLLTEHQIDTKLIAEQVEADEPVAAEAALGGHVWTLVVPHDRYEETVELAVAQHYCLPIAAAGDGAATTGALRGARGLDEAAAVLAELDTPLDATPGVSRDGLVRGETWAWLRTRPQPVLGAQARAEALASRRARLDEITAVIPELERQAAQARLRATAVRLALDALDRRDGLVEALQEADDAAEAAGAAAREITGQLAHFASEVSRLGSTLEARREKHAELTESEGNIARNLRGQDTRLADVDRRLAEVQPSDEPEDIEIASVEVLEHDLNRLAEELVDESRFPEEVRGELVLVHRENQERTVREVEQMVEGRKTDLNAVEHEVDRAKERYERHIREVVNLLARRFREICEQAQIEGDIEIVPGAIEGEFGIDVKVAHVPGEPRRSYRSRAHSTGQKAKISILLLLSAMSLEGAADLLIMDEHSAHLDSRNIDHVAAAMKALSSRVQFILATPTNDEAKRLHWADHQLGFYPRVAGEDFAPPVVLMTRLPEDERRYLEIGQLSLAD